MVYGVFIVLCIAMVTRNDTNKSPNCYVKKKKWNANVCLYNFDVVYVHVQTKLRHCRRGNKCWASTTLLYKIKLKNRIPVGCTLLSRYYNNIYIANFNRRKRNNNSRRTYVHGYNTTGLIITAMTFFGENRIPSAGFAPHPVQFFKPPRSPYC